MHKNRSAPSSHATPAVRLDDRDVAATTHKRMLQALIADAIRSLHQIEFMYDGEFRIVEPYVLGTHLRGLQVLKAWQIYGTDPGWRIFRLDRMSALCVTETVFRPAHESPADEIPMKTIQARVSSAWA